MTREEAFLLHMSGLWNDAINNHTGLLRSVAARLPHEFEDEVHGSLKDFLQRQIDVLQIKRNRAIRDIKEMLGGEESYRLLKKEDFDKNCTPSAHGWQNGGEKCL